MQQIPSVSSGMPPFTKPFIHSLVFGVYLQTVRHYFSCLESATLRVCVRYSHCLDNILDRSNLEKGVYLDSHLGKARQWEWLWLWWQELPMARHTGPPVGKQREMNARASSLSSLSQSMGCCHPHSGRVSLPQWKLSRKALTDLPSCVSPRWF